MSILASWILATAITAAPVAPAGIPTQIDVDCEVDGLLERVLAKVAAKAEGDVDIRLHGMCRGNFVIASDGVTLRAGRRGSGVSGPEGTPQPSIVVEVAATRAALRGLAVEGGDVGVLVGGAGRELLLHDVDVHDQNFVGAIARDGATLRAIETTFRDSLSGIIVQSSSRFNLQGVEVSGHDDIAITVTDRSSGAMSDSRVENNGSAGINVGDRSNVNILGGAFRENGEVHINANDYSDINLLFDIVIGFDTDSTPFSIGSNRRSMVSSYSAPEIYGDVSALNNGSIQIGNTVLHGDLLASVFADALVRNAEITGVVACSDGAQAICRGTTSAGVIDCPSTSCGTAVSAGETPTPAIRALPVPDTRRFDRPAKGLARR